MSHPRNNSSLNDTHKESDHHSTEIEEEIQYDHPALPAEIKLRKRFVKRRTDIFKELTKSNDIENEKQLRCEQFKEGLYGNIPTTFMENTNKEELILEHVKKYKAQFKIAYKDDTRQFLICPPNECGVRKFICTTIRPTKLGYTEFYDFEQCAKYIANFILYESLENPLRYPSIIPSPTSTIMWQKGDCIDISLLLVSLLIGVGYDAYCVLGTAPRGITLKNEALMDNPFINEGLDIIEKKTELKEAEEENRYRVSDKDAVISKFDKNTKEKANEEQIKKQFERTNILDDDEPDRLPLDPFIGLRVHSWVLLKKGSRELPDDLFIEPSTGRIWELKDKCYPYLKCSQLFNNRNYWVNLRPELPIEEVNFQNMNNGEKNEWEYAMLDTVQFPSIQENEDGDYQSEEEEILDHNNYQNVDKIIKEISHLIDMPLPWAPRLYIDKDKFLKGSPLGEITRFYKNSRVDFFTKYSQIDGMTKRIVLYDDFNRTLVREIRCIYQNRRNNLVMRRRFPFEFKTIEYYKPNNKPLEPNSGWPHWKSIEEIDRQKRIIKFYPYRHDDGLIERREFVWRDPIETDSKRKKARGPYNQTEDLFEGRDDMLEYRSFRYVPKGDKNSGLYSFSSGFLGEASIQKMEQRFGKNRFKPANDQVQQIVIDLDPAKNRITIYYHLNEGEIDAICRVYQRNHLTGVPAMPDGTEQKDEDPEDQLRQQKTYNMEKDCFNGIKTAEAKNKDELKTFRDEVEKKINSHKSNHEDAIKDILEKTLHDRAREKYKEDLKRREEEAEAEAFEDDYLAPFWDEKIPMNKVLDHAEALKLKNEVLKKFKERIISRADIIDKRIKEETALLEQKVKQHERKAGDGNDKKDDVKSGEDIIALQTRINILQSRASRFEVKAIEEYQKLQRKLNTDDRLKNLKDNDSKL